MVPIKSAQILVVDFAVRFGLVGEQTIDTPAMEHFSVLTDKDFADAKKFANRPTRDSSAAC